MLEKKTASCDTDKPYVLQFEHKHYNQLLSINKLLSPQLKIHKQDFICTIIGYLQRYNHFNAMSNYFVMPDIVNSHVPWVPFDDSLGFLYQNPLCESSGIFHSLLHRFRNLEPTPGNQIIKQLRGCQKNWKSCTLGWKVNAGGMEKALTFAWK